MSKSVIHYEKYRDEHSMNIAVACDIRRMGITVLYHDMSLDRRIARSAALNFEINPGNAAAELERLIFLSMREFKIPASAIKAIGCAAPVIISEALEYALNPTDMFLPPDVKTVFLPFASLYADGRFTASLAASPLRYGCVISDFDRTLNMAYVGDNLRLSTVPLVGAFDGSGLEDGMYCEFGAIDEVRREQGKTICYRVVGDGDGLGTSPSAALDSICIMLSEGIIDQDGIMVDRDLFSIGEDIFISQSDVRAIQSDKAKAGAALNCFLRATDGYSEVYLTGEVFAGNGIKRLAELGTISEAMSKTAAYSRSTVEAGIIAYLLNDEKRALVDELIASAVDITDEMREEMEKLYIEMLSF